MMGMAARRSRAFQFQSNTDLGEEDQEGEAQLHCSDGVGDNLPPPQ